MRKKIAVEELRLGMHVHEFCGSWLELPFWRTRFTLNDAQTLEAARGCGVTHCWIDVAKGLDVAPAPGAPAPSEPAAVAPPVRQAPEPARVSQQDELKRSVALLDASREAVVEMFGQARMGLAVDAKSCLPLVESISASVMRHGGAMVSLARLKRHDDYTYMHSVAVCALMIALARQLGLDEDAVRAAGTAGLLHDLGKAVMPAEVLNKPGKLTDDEFSLIKRHPERGHELLAKSGEASETVLDVCLHHHEKTDGSGYPHGLEGDRISLPARMGAVCDVYDAITSNRPYKQGWDPAESIGRMAEWRRGHFDETVFQAFVRSLGIYPTGSLVRMKSGRLAVVVEQNAASLTAPVVKVFFSTRSQMHITPELIDLSRPGCADRITGRESNREWKFTHLDELWAGAEVLRR
ncbi:MAG: HD-GYP domain-containing protein [Burkholderiaceae bacterium]|nr:HD-GYP domain-containing protein [Burkholderiaceae bacterium]